MSQIVYRGKFVFELIIACGLFAFCLPKRKKFVLRLIGSLLVIFALSACWSPMREYPFVLNFLKYFYADILLFDIFYKIAYFVGFNYLAYAMRKGIIL